MLLLRARLISLIGAAFAARDLAYSGQLDPGSEPFLLWLDLSMHRREINAARHSQTLETLAAALELLDGGIYI